MGLVSATEMIKKAHEGHYAICAFNINNLEWIKSILTACEKAKAPVMLEVSEGANKYMCGFKNVVQMVTNVMEYLNITVPVALHLDHGTYEGAKKAIEAGYTSVMFDGSHYPFEENLAKSKEIIALAHAKGISVECEVGGIGGSEDGVTSAGEQADPEECKKIASLGVDFLAAGIGNIHGIYPKDWQGLNLDLLAKIQEATSYIPLVLHGGTGIPYEMVRSAIERGVSKVNINTDLQLAFQEGTREYIEAGKDLDKDAKGFDPRKLLKPGCVAIEAKVEELLKAFGSYGQAA